MFGRFIYSLCFGVLITACGGGGSSNSTPVTMTDRTHVLGEWEVTRDNCDALITFGTALTQIDPAFDGTALSGSQTDTALLQYRFVEAGSTSRAQLDLLVLFNNGIDCDGDATDISGQSLTVYIEFTGDTMRWYDQQQGGNLLEAFTYNTNANKDIFGALPTDPSLLIDDVRITPNPVTTGSLAQMMIEIDYTITTNDEINIQASFNDQFIDPRVFLGLPNSSAVSTTVNGPASGSVTLFSTVNVPDWQPDSDFKAAIGLSKFGRFLTVKEFSIPQTP